MKAACIINSSLSFAPPNNLHFQLTRGEYSKCHQESGEVREWADPTGYKLQGEMRQQKRKNQQDHPSASIKRHITELSLVKSLEGESLTIIHPVKEPTPNEIWTRSDLASHLILSEVPHEAKTVQWCNGQSAEVHMFHLLLTPVLDMGQHTKDWMHPHRDRIIGRLLDGVQYPDEQLCTLNILLPVFMLPSPFQTLDHAAVYAWSETTHEYPLEDTQPHPDVFLGQSWGLLHQAGIYTTPHHDSNRQNTFITIVSSIKMWSIYDIEDTLLSCDEAAGLFNRLCNIDTNLFQLPKGLGDRGCGALSRFMPPGKFHEVYTPVVTFATVKHFLSYHTMHLSEWLRFLDQLHGHPMAVPLQALSLCQYILQHAIEDDNVPQPSEKGGKKKGKGKGVKTALKDNIDSKHCSNRADKFATLLLQALNLKSLQAASVLDDQPYNEVGAEVEFMDVLTQFQAY
ncbi:hypothetical protein EDB19DRAFT_1824049 [Suillus lakei]|nr:hypothetical protein EDB19DRAFT_1824049 [Suillus lakei]